MILAGDVGGTKTNLALYDVKDSQIVCIASKQFKSQKYAKFTDIIDAFLQENTSEAMEAACFGIAGPVMNNECRTTNLPWETITLNELQTNLDTQKIALLNDLAATAYGMLYLDEKEFITLNPNGIQKNATRCVIAAGTGLGEGILYYDETQKSYHPLATEGGHSDFAPQNRLEDALLVWLRKYYPDHVSCERILSGNGIYTLYSFLKEYTGLPEHEKMQNLDQNSNSSNSAIDKNAMVSTCAFKDNDPLCTKTLEIFSKLYGAEAGNLALKSLSYGGVYIGGGIAPKILPILQNGFFMEGFLEKGRFKSLLERMEVKVSLNQETALLGAVYYARDKLLND
jgi:glucokinase